MNRLTGQVISFSPPPQGAIADHLQANGIQSYIVYTVFNDEQSKTLYAAIIVCFCRRLFYYIRPSSAAAHLYHVDALRGLLSLRRFYTFDGRYSLVFLIISIYRPFGKRRTFQF